MTALREFARLESGGLWRESPDAQSRDVILTFGDATLVISDSAGRPLTHWSLPAIERLNAGERPALFSPDPQATETVEVEDDLMIDAIEKVRKVVHARRPQSGRLRNFGIAGVALAVIAVGIFWVPGMLTRHTAGVLPPVKQTEIGAQLLGHIQRLTGPICRSRLGTEAMATLHARVLGPDAGGQAIVVPGGADVPLYLPGDLIVLNRALIEDTEDPAVVAGHMMAAIVQRDASDPMVSVLEHAGLRATVRLLTTGEIESSALRSYAEDLLKSPPTRPAADTLLPLFEGAGIPSTPYAYAVDVTGETVLPLVEGDPMRGQEPRPLISDTDWISLQGICG